MSVIIKGMKLPLPGDMMVCALIDGKLQCSIVTRGKPIEWCEVLEVPTPHGRLIDADRLLTLVEKEVNNTCIGCEPEPDDCCAYDRFKEIISEIKTAQTIIEAEVSE